MNYLGTCFKFPRGGRVKVETHDTRVSWRGGGGGGGGGGVDILNNTLFS
jgi:hypothetical protein